MNSKEKLFRVIQMYGFALDEIRIYLDTHPDCQEINGHGFRNRGHGKGALINVAI